MGVQTALKPRTIDSSLDSMLSTRPSPSLHVVDSSPAAQKAIKPASQPSKAPTLEKIGNAYVSLDFDPKKKGPVLAKSDLEAVLDAYKADRMKNPIVRHFGSVDVRDEVMKHLIDLYSFSGPPLRTIPQRIETVKEYLSQTHLSTDEIHAALALNRAVIMRSIQKTKDSPSLDTIRAWIEGPSNSSYHFAKSEMQSWLSNQSWQSKKTLTEALEATKHLKEQLSHENASNRVQAIARDLKDAYSNFTKKADEAIAYQKQQVANLRERMKAAPVSSPAPAPAAPYVAGMVDVRKNKTAPSSYRPTAPSRATPLHAVSSASYASAFAAPQESAESLAIQQADERRLAAIKAKKDAENAQRAKLKEQFAFSKNGTSKKNLADQPTVVDTKYTRPAEPPEGLGLNFYKNLKSAFEHVGLMPSPAQNNSPQQSYQKPSPSLESKVAHKENPMHIKRVVVDLDPNLIASIQDALNGKQPVPATAPQAAQMAAYAAPALTETAVPTPEVTLPTPAQKPSLASNVIDYTRRMSERAKENAAKVKLGAARKAAQAANAASQKMRVARETQHTLTQRIEQSLYRTADSVHGALQNATDALYSAAQKTYGQVRKTAIAASMLGFIGFGSTMTPPMESIVPNRPHTIERTIPVTTQSDGYNARAVEKAQFTVPQQDFISHPVTKERISHAALEEYNLFPVLDILCKDGCFMERETYQKALKAATTVRELSKGRFELYVMDGFRTPRDQQVLRNKLGRMACNPRQENADEICGHMNGSSADYWLVDRLSGEKAPVTYNNKKILMTAMVGAGMEPLRGSLGNIEYWHWSNPDKQERRDQLISQQPSPEQRVSFNYSSRPHAR